MGEKPVQTWHLNIQIDATNKQTVLTVLQVIQADLGGGDLAGNGGSHLTDYCWELIEDDVPEKQETVTVVLGSDVVLEELPE
jgi:hypothetical protein